MNTSKPVTKLSRAQIREALETVPLDSLFPAAASRELTAKQKRFARDVAMGKTKADAYRDNYNVTSKATMTSRPYALAADDRVKAEIEAYKMALETAKHRNPAALRELVIQSLVKVIIDPDAKPGQITAAAKVLGTVTEVAAFTERKEVRTITSSEDARAAIMAQLKQLSNSSAEDAHIIDAQADELMAELKSGGSDTHRGATPQADSEESLAYMHTIPLEQSHPKFGSLSDSDLDPENPDGNTPPPSSEETPPVIAQNVTHRGGYLLKK
jgi:hypothetical protein